MKIIPVLPMQRSIWCHIYAAIFSLFVLTPIVIMLFDRRQPVTLELISFEPNSVHEGDEATVTYKSVVHKDGCGGELLRTIVDSAKKVTAFVREPTIFNGRKIGNTEKEFIFSKTLTIPRGLTPGPAIYVPLIDRWCNPLQRFLWPIQQSPLPSITFNVLR